MVCARCRPWSRSTAAALPVGPPTSASGNLPAIYRRTVDLPVPAGPFSTNTRRVPSRRKASIAPAARCCWATAPLLHPLARADPPERPAPSCGFLGGLPGACRRGWFQWSGELCYGGLASSLMTSSLRRPRSQPVRRRLPSVQTVTGSGSRTGFAALPRALTASTERRRATLARCDAHSSPQARISSTTSKRPSASKSACSTPPIVTIGGHASSRRSTSGATPIRSANGRNGCKRGSSGVGTGDMRGTLQYLPSAEADSGASPRSTPNAPVTRGVKSVFQRVASASFTHSGKVISRSCNSRICNSGGNTAAVPFLTARPSCSASAMSRLSVASTQWSKVPGAITSAPSTPFARRRISVRGTSSTTASNAQRCTAMLLRLHRNGSSLVLNRTCANASSLGRIDADRCPPTAARAHRLPATPPRPTCGGPT